MIGRTIKQYEIEETLGKGGMGVVYRARDPRLERRVALKVLSDEFTGDRHRQARFLQEARQLLDTRFLAASAAEQQKLANQIAGTGTGLAIASSSIP